MAIRSLMLGSRPGVWGGHGEQPPRTFNGVTVLGDERGENDDVDEAVVSFGVGVSFWSATTARKSSAPGSSATRRFALEVRVRVGLG